MLAAVTLCPRAAMHEQSKGKNRAMPQLAGDVHASLLRGDNCFCDGQAHAGASHEISLVFPPVELFKDHGLLEIIDARTTVRDTDGYGGNRQVFRKCDRPVLLRNKVW